MIYDNTKYGKCTAAFQSEYATRHTSHVSSHTSHISRHTTHITRHTSHIIRHPSHVTHHCSAAPTADDGRVMNTRDPRDTCSL